jgi:hypothetical protein
MVGGRTALRRACLFIAGGAAAAPSADAGAWSLAQGAQQWFATVSRETGDFGEAWRADDFVEIGLGDGWGVNAKLEGQIRIGSTYDDRTGYRLGVQKAFALGERASFAMGVSLIGGESLDGAECVGTGYEARAALGTSFALWGREGYVNAEVGQRSRGDCERSVMEVATGLAFAENWLLSVKAWREGGGFMSSAKAELGLMYDWDGLGIGVGWREEVSGNFEEKGWVLSVKAAF